MSLDSKSIPVVDDYFMAPAETVLRDYTRNLSPHLTGLTDVRFLRLGVIGFDEKKVALRTARRRDQCDPGKRVPSQEMVRHAFALTCQFIRLVRHCLRYKIPWDRALPLFQRRTAVYL